MKFGFHFNDIVFAIEAFLMALGAALETQVATVQGTLEKFSLDVSFIENLFSKSEISPWSAQGHM